MSYAIAYAREAVADLESIFGYISIELENPIAAIRITEDIQTQVRTLAEMPSRFRLHYDQKWADLGVRVMVVGHFEVYYRVDEERETVFVIRVMYERQDYPDPAMQMVAEEEKSYGKGK